MEKRYLNDTKVSLCENAGFSLIECLIAAGILAFIAIGLSLFVNTEALSSEVIGNSTCTNFTSNIITSIKSHGNSLKVENFLPATTNNRKKNQGQHSESLSYFAVDEEGYVNINNPKNFFNFQNIDDATNWAMKYYNATVRAGDTSICTGRGKTFSGPTELQALIASLPSAVQIPESILSAQLFIKSSDESCGQIIDRHPLARKSIKVSITAFQKINGSKKRAVCTDKASLNQTLDTSPPVLTANFINDKGEVVPPLTRIPCSCEGGSCSNVNAMSIHMISSEPGSLFFCRREGVDSKFRYCGDLGNISFSNSNTPNSPTTVVLDLNGLTEGTTTRIRVVAVDTAGNKSEFSSLAAVVGRPRCPSPSTVPCGTFVADSCGNPGACGSSASSCGCVPTCPDPKTIPCGAFVADSCGNDSACGYDPQTCNCTVSCPDPSTYMPGREPLNGCGGKCPTGEKKTCLCLGCTKTCPDPSEYPAWMWVEDGCGGKCPDGTAPAIGEFACPKNCRPPDSICPGIQMADGCGGICPEGNAGAIPNCPDDPSLYCADETPSDGCGGWCPTGTKVDGCRQCYPTCPDPRTYCAGMEPDDGCGGICPTGLAPKIAQ